MRKEGVEEEMKKLGNQFTMKGQIAVNEGNIRLNLFDGRFDTGHRIEKFEIVASTPLESVEFQMILSTEELTDITSFQYADNTQFGWAIWGAPLSTRFSQWSQIDPDNLVIEDLFLSCRGGTDDTFVNYMITMQKYKVSDWTGALAMVRNRSQA